MTDTFNPACLNKLFGILFRYSRGDIREDILSVYTHINICMLVYRCG